LQAALRLNSMAEVCDAIIVPALLRVEEDHDRGTLIDAKRQMILDHISQWVDERLDSMAGSKGRTPGFADCAAPAPVFCVPASDRADALIAKLFEVALVERGQNGRVIAAKDAAELVVAGSAVAAIVISALPPEAVTPARAACKHVRANGGGVPVIVGLWNAEGDLDRARQRLASAGATRIVTSFAECISLLEVGNTASGYAEGDGSTAPEPTRATPTPLRRADSAETGPVTQT
jgi:hypothetical protein